MKGCAIYIAVGSLAAAAVACSKGDYSLSLAQLAIGSILLVGLVMFVGWSSGGNTPAPYTGQKVITSDVPGHPEYATMRASEIVNQRESGRWRGGALHVYVNSDPEHADWHSQQRNIDWLEEKDRAARNGVQVHHVTHEERDWFGSLEG